jgi:glyoxylase-like metal-dependent hydrolase (beta-lactamase superfamily II)
MTLEGTNTWIVGREPALVIDPGPDDRGHLGEVAGRAGRVAAILLTHHHPDHAPGAAALASMTGANVMALRPVAGEGRLRDGETIEAGGVRLAVVSTPGHTQDHVTFHEPDLRALFTGDAVLGRGTSVIDPPEGDLSAYLRSLERMVALRPSVLYPGHGPAVWSAMDKLTEYVRHRQERERQVLEGLEGGARTPGELVPAIYADYPAELHPLAERSVLAHLLKLEREGRAARVGKPSDDRFEVSTPRACARCGRPAPPRATLCGRCSLAVLQEAPGAGEATT